MKAIRVKWCVGSIAVLAIALGGFIVHESSADPCNGKQAFDNPAPCASDLPFCEQISGQSACLSGAGNYDIQSYSTACTGPVIGSRCVENVSLRCYAVYSCVWNGGCMQGTFSHWVNTTAADAPPTCE